MPGDKMTLELPSMQGPVCPLPLAHQQQIVMGHGSGGKMSLDLISQFFIPSFDNPALRAGDDAAVLNLTGPDRSKTQALRLAISTDSHVVTPLFFPGGDIGRLAVCGTVNDVAMMGATPRYLTASFILEEGLDMQVLARVIGSMQSAAQEAGVAIIAGDTKVVQKGKADGLYISTTGVGVILEDVQISGSRARPGDAIILSGTIGDHGIAVLGARGELGFESDIQSDIAPLNHIVQAAISASKRIHVMRDPTRGGLATSLNEIARQSRVGILLNESEIPVKPAVASACEMLGFDPLYIANEGKLIIILPQEDAETVLEAVRRTPYGADAVIIGAVQSEPRGRVLMRTTFGTTRIVDIPTGEILPRIC
jgi:hydrogenase expression/formation protein HypE